MLAGELIDTEFWRVRVGDLRVIYAIDDPADVVVVLKIARRSESTYGAVASDEVFRQPSTLPMP